MAPGTIAASEAETKCGDTPRKRYDPPVNAVSRKPRQNPATLADLLAIPEERRRHEIIDGELIEKDASTGEHGGAQGDLVGTLRQRFQRKPGGRYPGGWWFATEVEIALGRDVVRPDVVGWRRERAVARPTGTPVALLPDWIAEILSTNRSNDLVKKKRRYHEARIPHYWILDPIGATLAVYRWTADGYLEVLLAERDETVRAEPFDAVEIPVGTLFGDDEPDE
jgi:Uma2 family endonuclease